MSQHPLPHLRQVSSPLSVQYLQISPVTISKYKHSFLGILTKHFPSTLLASSLHNFLLSTFTHNSIIDTSNPPPFVSLIRLLQELGLSTLMERELSVVVAEKVREFIYIEAKEDWTRRYTGILTDWVDNGLADLLKFILGGEGRNGVGEETLKTIALRALTELRYARPFERRGEADLGLMSCLILSRSFQNRRLRLRISKCVSLQVDNETISSTSFVRRTVPFTK